MTKGIMGVTGLERLHETPGNSTDSQEGGAESGAPEDSSSIHTASLAWNSLSEDERREILALLAGIGSFVAMRRLYRKPGHQKVKADRLRNS
jgi:hypothetical protein